MATTRDFGDKYIWRKANRSNGSGGACVFVAALDTSAVGVRDSKLGNTGPVIRMTSADWASLTRAVSR